MAIRVLAPICGWLVAMLLHGTFNLVASFLPSWVAQMFGDNGGLGAAIVANGSFIVALFPLFAIGVGVAIYVRQSQFRVVKRGLPQYAAAGWIGQPEVEWLSSLRGRSQARKWAKQVAGPPGLTAMKEYQFAASRLAILRDGANHGQVGPTFTQTEQELLSALGQQRLFFSPHSPDGPVPGGSAPGYGQPPSFAQQAASYPTQAAPAAYGQPPYGQSSGPPSYGQASAPPSYGAQSYGQPSGPPSSGPSPYGQPSGPPADPTGHGQSGYGPPSATQSSATQSSATQSWAAQSYGRPADSRPGESRPADSAPQGQPASLKKSRIPTPRAAKPRPGSTRPPEHLPRSPGQADPLPSRAAFSALGAAQRCLFQRLTWV